MTESKRTLMRSISALTFFLASGFGGLRATTSMTTFVV